MTLSILSLLLGYLLPWAAGYLWLRVLQARDRGAGQRLIATGAAFFFAIAGITGLLRLQDAVTGSVSNGPVLLLAVLAGTLALALMQRMPVQPRPQAPLWPRQRWAQWSAALLCLLVLLHTTFSLLELVTQPLFPWDGWTVWAYRGKAWFLQGGLAPILASTGWFPMEGDFAYPMNAYGYPILPSLIYLWTALNLGSWHEALVNVPVLFCALAIAGLLAGCLRQQGFGTVATLAAVYLLVSLPLFATHMSLGGYADIWLAGFAGGGMTLLLCGLLSRRQLLQGLGLALLFLAPLVKVEGGLWLAAGLLIFLLNRLSGRQLALLAGLVLLLPWLGIFTGHTFLDLPGIGRIGFSDTVIYLPVKGIITLELHDVRDAYFQNAFMLGSWHLLWLAVLGSLLALPRVPRRLRLLNLAFFAVFLALQVVIFVFTTEGAWAQDYTAINRLPLQMLPAILFLLATTLRAALQGAPVPRQSGWAGRSLLSVTLAGAVVVLTVVALEARSLGNSEAALRTIAPSDLNFLVGGGKISEAGIEVQRYQDGIALLSSGPVEVDAAELAFLELALEFDEQIESLDQAPAFFWRRSDQQREVSRYTLDGSGFIDLTLSEDWYGTIVEYGFFFVENRGEPAMLSDVRLEGRSLVNELLRIPEQWLVFIGWTQRSSHWLPGGALEQKLPLMALVVPLVLLAIVLGWLLCGRQALLPVALVCLASGWLMLDARWLLERRWQADLSFAQLQNMSIDERSADGELGIYFDYIQRLRDEVLGPEPARIMLILDPAEHKYYGLRSKYQLLPHAVRVVPELPPKPQLNRADYVLYLGDFTDGPPGSTIGENRKQQAQRLGLDEHWKRAWLLPEDQDMQGTLFRVSPPFRRHREQAGPNR